MIAVEMGTDSFELLDNRCNAEGLDDRSGDRGLGWLPLRLAPDSSGG